MNKNYIRWGVARYGEVGWGFVRCGKVRLQFMEFVK